jgi:hypothetical protein
MAQNKPILRIAALLVVVLMLAILAGAAYYLFEVQPHPPIAPGGVLFSDDFSVSGRGWETWEGAEGSWVGHQSGGLRILVGQPYYDYWTRLPERYTDVYIEVDALTIGGPNDNNFGLLCRAQGDESYYAFLITSDGYYGIIKVHNGSFVYLSAPDGLTYSESIHRGLASNRIGAYCAGGHLLLAVNGEVLAQADDDDLSSGQVGLTAGSSEEAGVDILFDNFVIYQP